MVIIGLEIAFLTAVIVFVFAWMADSVGGAGFWYNVGVIALGFGRIALFIGGVGLVLFVAYDLVRRVF